jgi:hypothetical protein
MDSFNNLVGGLDLKSVSGTFPGKGKNISDYAGPAGMLALLTAMFSSNASSSIRIVVYGMILEIVRRLSAWLYARLVVRAYSSSESLFAPPSRSGRYKLHADTIIEPKVSATFNQGDPVYEWVMLYLVIHSLPLPRFHKILTSLLSLPCFNRQKKASGKSPRTSTSQSSPHVGRTPSHPPRKSLASKPVRISCPSGRTRISSDGTDTGWML